MKWAKGIVEWIDGDTANISVVFSWDAAKAYSRAVWYKQQGFRVRVGGPGVFVLGKMLKGVADEIGGSIKDAVVHHNPLATFASRGCDVGCWFCIVPPMEGSKFTLIPDFPVRPILCDNNLSGLPVHYQEHIIKRYKDTGVPLLDANSGFDPTAFDEDTYARWKPINKGPWRYAYDETGEREGVYRTCKILKDVPPNLKRVYVLIGNEPFEACMTRIKEVIGWGAEPHVQPVMKLNASVKRPWVKKDLDWSAQLLVDVARWIDGFVWRKHSFAEYKRAMKKRKQPHSAQEVWDFWNRR